MKLNLEVALNSYHIRNAGNAVYNGRPVRFFSNMECDTFSLYEDKDPVLSTGTCNKYQFDTDTRAISRIPNCTCQSDEAIRLSCLQHAYSGRFRMTVGGRLVYVMARFLSDKVMDIVHDNRSIIVNENRRDWIVQNNLLTFDPIDLMIEDYDGVAVGDMVDWLKDNGISRDSKMRAAVVNSDTGVISNGIVVSVEEVQ